MTRYGSMDSTFAQRLREARKARGMTQAELARTLEIHEVELARYERGRFKPRQERAERLAQALSVSPAWLVFGEGRGPESTPAVSPPASAA